MLHYAWVFLVLAIIAAIFGFGGVAVAAAGIAKICSLSSSRCSSSACLPAEGRYKRH